ncbi:MAG: glycerophosphodiester phosphodiesterase [Clostridia bacterium]|nr:glycerophosphodiester phosphodiesterase [Clostridia bacterium]
MKTGAKIIIGVTAAAIAGAAITAGYICKVKSLKAVIPERFTVTAHTGCEGTADNTLEAISAGATAGADVVEFDLNFNADGEPVLAHDEAKKDSVTLKEAFRTVAKHENLKVNVDVKTTDNLKVVVQTANECGVFDRIFYTGIEAKDVEAVKRDTPEVSYYLNTDIEKSKKNSEEYIRSLVSLTKESGAVGINIHYSGASKKMVDIFHGEALQVSVWTVNDELAMHKVLALGCDNITTRQPTKLIEVINSKI